MVLWLLLLLCDTQEANALVNVLTFHHDLWLFVKADDDYRHYMKTNDKSCTEHQ